MEWVIVSVIVVMCALLAVRALVLGLRDWFGSNPAESGSRSPCGNCGGCKTGSSTKEIPIVTLESKVRR
ncbi:MAG: hypothetical protein ACK57G_05535 [Planctomycetota bacterium]|jgi:hypothetical protein